MNTCQECNQVFKYDRKGVKAKEHYDRFHALPKLKGSKIQLNASHQVCLIVKGGNTWEQYFKKQKKKDNSWNRDGKILQQFEKDNNIVFQYCDDSERLSFDQTNIPLYQKIWKFFVRK